MAKYQVQGKLFVEFGMVVEADSEEEARGIAEETDLDSGGWVEVQDDFEVTWVGLWTD
jgi:hypothetical protein